MSNNIIWITDRPPPKPGIYRVNGCTQHISKYDGEIFGFIGYTIEEVTRQELQYRHRWNQQVSSWAHFGGTKATRKLLLLEKP